MCVLDFLYANFSESTVSTKALFSMPRILKLFWKRGINPCLDCGARSFILLYYWTNQTIDHTLSSIFESIFSLLHPRVIKCPRKWHLIQINFFYFSALLIFDLHLIFFGTTISIWQSCPLFNSIMAVCRSFWRTLRLLFCW